MSRRPLGIGDLIETIRIESVSFAAVEVTARTTWTFAEFRDADGLETLVEITSGHNTKAVVAMLIEAVTTLSARELSSEADVSPSLGLAEVDVAGKRPLETAVSALRTATAQIQATRSGQSLTRFLGGEDVESIPLYANINRHLLTRERSPRAFADAAELAVQRGFDIVKCAPFDEASPPSSVEDIVEMAGPGMERVAAIREAVGPDVRLLVDCHSRFEVHTAPVVAAELAKFDIGWFEEPVSPIEDPSGLSSVAAKVAMSVAGGESGYGKKFFDDLIKRNAVSIIMPDVKYCGGVVEACKAGRSATNSGSGVSLHCPSGPISLLASAHVTAAVEAAMPLEHAVYEADWRADLIEPRERIEEGRLWFAGGPGLGAVLNDDVVNRHGRRFGH
ncbi:MAG: mandelate racemase/muconate lactonizing enzyme family protein [Chloroflexi bacterium]|nr:mandelate racemase/muconate lactonizing enzyme family protein [Chloroflexota bacterium]